MSGPSVARLDYANQETRGLVFESDQAVWQARKKSHEFYHAQCNQTTVVAFIFRDCKGNQKKNTMKLLRRNRIKPSIEQ